MKNKKVPLYSTEILESGKTEPLPVTECLRIDILYQFNLHLDDCHIYEMGEFSGSGASRVCALENLSKQISKKFSTI